jgi:hypothetical protein
MQVHVADLVPGEERRKESEPPGDRVLMRAIDSSVSATPIRATRYAGLPHLVSLCDGSTALTTRDPD